MEPFKQLCLNYRNELRPYLEMLKLKKPLQKREEWLALVKKTERNILKSPDQYLNELEKKDVTEKAVHFVFEEFLAELDNTRAKQG